VARGWHNWPAATACKNPSDKRACAFEKSKCRVKLQNPKSDEASFDCEIDEFLLATQRASVFITRLPKWEDRGRLEFKLVPSGASIVAR